MEAWTIVDTSRLRHLLNAGALILDCRFNLADTLQGRREYDAGHVPSAVHADLDHDLSAPEKRPELGRHPMPDAASFAHRLGDWGWDGNRPVVAYDGGSGAIAARAWWLLRMAGFGRVAVLDGGWSAWRAAELPTEQHQRAHTHQQHPLHLMLNRDRVLDTAQLEAELKAGSCLLIDARATERYLGKTEPIDAVAGHVPGARNRPFASNLDAHGHFKSADQLKDEFTQLLDGRQPREVVHMCGSGVTACHNLLAMEHAGLIGSRLYAPSWSGWISDPKRPVANDH